MPFGLALIAAFGCSLCIGVAAVLEKVSADREARVSSLQIGLLVRLLDDWPYLFGLALDGASFLLTVVAVQNLPLFVAEPVIALNVVITALLERLLFQRRLRGVAWVAFVGILVGLSLLAISGGPERARTAAAAVRWAVILLPLGVAAAGAVVATRNRHGATVALGVLDGVAFGGTAVAGRMLVVPHQFWQILLSPLLWSMLAYGLVGLLLFTIALQRSHASVIGASTTAAQSIVPIVVGIAFLGDSPRDGAWAVAVAGMVLTLAGTLAIALTKVVPDLCGSAPAPGPPGSGPPRLPAGDGAPG
jgi:drug/metabolite transporter (DMT)-like permease